jgi:hypothetical protein
MTMAGGTGPHSFPYEAQVTASRRTTLCRRLSRVRAPETFSIGPTGEPASGYVVRVPEEEAVGDLVEDEGVNAGSRDAERDREPSGRPPVRPKVGGPPAQAPPAERLVGPPAQDGRTPGQELAAGEK